MSNNDKPVHERVNGQPFCGARSLSMGTTQEVTCHRCLILLRDGMARELCNVVRKLAQPPMGERDKVSIQIHIHREDGQESTDPQIIIPDRF